MPRIFDISKPIPNSLDACTVFADTNAIVDLFYGQGGLVPNSRVSDKAPYLYSLKCK